MVAAQVFPDQRSGSAPGAAQERELAVWRVLESVPDPEIPVLSVVELGIVRHVRWSGDGHGSGGKDWPCGSERSTLHVGITPTYSGCPATEVIRHSIETALDQEGYGSVVIEEVLSPPWTSDWVTEGGRRKLEAFGIAPPQKSVSSAHALLQPPVVACPRCGSKTTERVSEFGSTPCKAHYRCTSCLEPFDHFKCL